MISSQRIFVLFILIFFSCRETLTAKIDSKIPKIVKPLIPNLLNVEKKN